MTTIRIELAGGQSYGRLALVRQVESNRNGHARWLCRCACGKETVTFSSNLRRGLSLSCGCARKDAGRQLALKSPDLTGRTFERLSVLHRAVEQPGSRWVCRCDCGEMRVVRGIHLLSGTHKSCGCLQRDNSTAANQAKKTHGKRHTPEYGVWWSMRQRCGNSTVKCYANYGGRGIKVCSRWESFECFYADMGPRPTNSHSIDRINNDGNYEPGNCRWATAREQASNKRRKKAVAP